jgi:hypothetical protein
MTGYFGQRGTIFLDCSPTNKTPPATISRRLLPDASDAIEMLHVSETSRMISSNDLFLGPRFGRLPLYALYEFPAAEDSLIGSPRFPSPSE